MGITENERRNHTCTTGVQPVSKENTGHPGWETYDCSRNGKGLESRET